MNNLLYSNLSVNESGNLCIGGHDTVELAQKFGTPLFVMDESVIRNRIEQYVSAVKKHFGNGSMPLFASKSLSIKAIYRIVKEYDMGIDVVSSGEIYTAAKAGFPLQKAYFHGNNKTDEDILYAMQNGIGCFVCDNLNELAVINSTAEKLDIIQKIMLRVTPGIDPHTHAKISTGKVDSKFGAAIETGQAKELLQTALELKNVEVAGFHCHIGSQIFETSPFFDAAKLMIEFIAEMKNDLGYEAKFLNLGGGIGVRYTKDDPQIDIPSFIEQLANDIKAMCSAKSVACPTILLEPGRSIVADSTLTLYTVGGRKEIPGFKNYVSIDGGMTDNPRYTLYQSRYTVLTANRMDEKADYACTIAGRCCESGDLIAEGVSIAKPERGDILAVLTTGAYNYSMASNYNAIAKPAIVMVNEKAAKIVVRRQSFEDMIALQE